MHRLLWSLFSVCFVVQAQNIALTPGVIVKGAVHKSEVLYYEIGLKGETSPLIVTVTPSGAGDPDIYVSLTEQHPMFNNTQHKSQKAGQDSVIITPDLFSTHKMAYIGVSGWLSGNQTAVSFSLVASFGVVELLNGVPANSEANSTTPARFTFQVPDRFSGEILIAATPTVGSVLLFASGSQPPDRTDKTTFDWSASMFSGSFKISTSDPKFPVSRKLFIGVFVLEHAKFSIVVTTSDKGTSLRDGVPRSSQIDVRPQEYFVFDVDRSGCNLTIVVTPMSGDPDLYVSTKDPHPSSNSSEYFSLKFGGDSVTIPSAKLGPYYISVESMVVNGRWSNSSFTVMASLSCGEKAEDFTYLIDGVPQDGFLAMAQTKFYKFAVSEQHSDLTISAYRKFGDPDLYIRNDGVFWDGMNVTASNWSSTAKGEDIITIHQNDAGFCRNCEYSITVLGITNTSYTIQARSSSTISTLVEGQPITEDLRAGESEYFQFHVDKSGATLTISVTDLGRGDPDLFVSKTNTRPSAANHTWAAQTIRGDSITIPPTDPEACVLCTYYIGVSAFTNTTFTLVASFSDIVALADGVPQTGAVAKGEFRYYTAHVVGDLTVSLTTISGQQSMYISTTVLPELINTTTFQWHDPWYSAIKTRTILGSDEHACKTASCHYSIGVYGGANGTYTISASTMTATKPLQNGIPAKDSVSMNQWKFFSFKIESAGIDFSIIVTPISGDPDLYVSLGKQPNATSFDRLSVRSGDDIVDYDNAPLGIYYIGVTAKAANASFSLTVMTADDKNTTVDSSDIITLLPGFPQAGVAYHNRFRYYKFLLETAVGELTFSCTKTFGDPDLYVNANNTLPTREVHDYSSLALAADVITIRNAKPGTFIIGVYGFSTSGFSLTASTDDGHVSDLQASVPLRGTLAARGWKYYVLELNAPNDLTVSVTPFDGDPDLYISTVTYPNATTAMWKAIAYRGDTITISKNDARFCVCKYYIGVFSYAPSSYTLVAEFGGQTRLAEGNPQSGQVSAGQITYYEARLMRGVQTQFTVTPTNGDIELLVSTRVKPTRLNATWRDASPHSGARVRIDPSDSAFCSGENCSYFVGVAGKENSNFTVLMTTTGSHIQLQDGIPVQTYLPKGEYGKFLFGCERAGVEVSIDLTTISGDADLYVHDAHFPNRTDSKYSSAIPGSDVVSIPNSKPTTYFISVYAFSNSTFTLTAYVQADNSTQATMLVGGVPQNGIVANRKYKYYSFHVSGVHQNLEISVSRFTGDPDLYVTNNGSQPSKTNYQWKSAMFGKDVIDIPHPEPGDYKIAVYAFTTSSFSIVASTTDTVEVLTDGVSFVKDLAAHEWEYFRLPIDATDKDLTVTVTPFGAGDPDLFISDTDPHPNMSAPWKSTNFRDDSITIPSSDLKVQTYYVGVNAFLNVTFSIVASLSATIRMQDGSVQAGEVRNGGIKYYTLDVQQATDALTFTLTPLMGRAFLYVSSSRKPDPKNHSSYQWSSFEDTIQSITVKPMDVGFCMNCSYHIAVLGVVNITRFSILASSSVAVISMQDGIGLTGAVDEKQWLYYSFALSNSHADLTVTVTPMSGDPDLYMSIDDQRPTLTNYTAKATAFGADIIHIDPSSPHYRLGVYYFGVTGFRNSTFSIMAKVTDLNGTVGKNQQVLLREGLPQIGFLPDANSFALFTFSPSDPKRTVTFTVTPRYGDPDLFVTDGANISDPKWSSKKWGQDTVTISDGCKDTTTSCTYTIKVKAVSGTLFSIVGSTGVVRLQQGVPLMANLEANSYQYYVFPVDRTDGELVVSLTALTGDPDLYLAFNLSKPNKTNWQWRSMAFGSDVIAVTEPKIGDYHVGVYSAFPSTYTITASVGALELIPGQPHRDEVASLKTRLYVVQVQSTPADLEISLDISSGDAVILVNNNPSDGRASWPSLSSHTWSSDNRADSTRRGSLIVSATDRKACFNCSYTIGVYGLRATSYAIVVRYGAIGTLLESGHPVTATVDQGATSYFRAFVNSKANDIQISSTTFVGDAAIYVSMTDSRPSASSHSWKSVNMKDSNHISILSSDPAFSVGTFFIGVYGVKKTTFSLSVTTHNVMLKDGVPQSGQCQQGGAFFFLNVENLEGDVTITLAGVDDRGTRGFGLYVHTDSRYNEPDSTHFLWKKDPILESESLVISAKDKNRCQRCTYFIGVHGTPTQEQETVRFMLRVRTANTYEILLDNKLVTGKLNALEWHYYEMYVTSARSLSLELETCLGNADIYVAQDNYAPNENRYKWGSAATDQVDSLIIKEGVISGASFFIGVRATLNNTDYRLLVTTGDIQEAVVPGEDGRISVATPKTGTIKLTFTPAVSSAKGPKKYSVMYSELGSGLVMYSVCGLSKALLADSIQTDSLQPVVRVVEDLKSDVGYLFNVLVEDAAGRKAVYDFVGPVYAPSYLELEGVSVGTILGFAIPAAVMVCALVMILALKNRKMTQELAVEMQGVPGSVLRKAIRGPRGADDGKPRGAEKKKYTSLLTTDEAEDDEEDEEAIGFYQS